MLSIGYSYRVPVEQIIAIVASDSAPIKRMIQRAREIDKLHDCTKGKKTRSAVITADEEIYLSAFTADSLANRLESAYLMSKVINAGANWLNPGYRSRTPR
ncbi:MAG: DUF370 domain-containing protein [Candidatus Sericytochromatia bacterium]